MDALTKELAELSVTASTSNKTGLVYHPDTLLHTYDENEAKCQIHVENPLRVKAILDHLQAEGLVDRCDFVSSFGEIDRAKIEKVHGADYAEYLYSLWPENTTKKKIAYMDTYYNQHSLRAALLAAEGTRLAAERVFAGKWRNAFCLVRPPGHHAAAKNNRIGGFCFINNVVIAAKELVEQLGAKRVAVLDWDVHHGDSTQLLTYNDPRILYVSIHKFCHGEFYPGPLGDAKYLGEAPAVGRNLNFPINPKPGQLVGDAEYVYLFERAVLPVLADFKPEVVLVSCGFDCLLYDPVGQFHVTQNALSHMLYQIRSNITQKLVVVLEGGYNLRTIPVAAECLLRVLLGEFYPNKANKYLISIDTMMKNLYLSEPFLRNTVANLEHWRAHWPCLDGPALQKLDQKVNKMKCKQGFTSRGHGDRTMTPEFYIKLNASAKEIENYEHMWKAFPEEMEGFIPRFFGSETVNGKRTLKLENLNPQADYSVMSIVIADYMMTSHFLSEVFKRYRFYVKGYQIIDEEGEVIECRRQVQTHLNIEDTLDYCRRFFKGRDRAQSLGFVDAVLGFLDKIATFVQAKRFFFGQACILLLINRRTGDVKLRLIKLGNFLDFVNPNFYHSLVGIHDFLQLLRRELDAPAGPNN